MNPTLDLQRLAYLQTRLVALPQQELDRLHAAGLNTLLPRLEQAVEALPALGRLAEELDAIDRILTQIQSLLRTAVDRPPVCPDPRLPLSRLRHGGR